MTASIGAARPSPVPPASLAALSGVVAGAAAVAAGEFLAGLVAGAPSPIVAVGAAVIDLQPAGAKDLVVALFGTNDKLVLNIVILLAVLALGAGLGVLARRRSDLARASIVAVAGVGLLAAVRDPTSSILLAAGAAVVEAGVAIRSLGWLLGAASTEAAAATEGAAGPDGARHAAGGSAPTEPASSAPTEPPGLARRGFLVRAGALGVAAIAGGSLGRVLLDRRATATAASDQVVPQPVDPAPSVPPGASLDVPGITPIVVPNDEFYRIDTALITPSVDAAAWRLRIHGMVDREVELSFDELVALPLIERYVTIACVSNEVGGDLVGNARWTGVRLTDVLELAGVRPDATQIVGRSVDGWTAGFPTAWVTDYERDAMIAVRMNGAPLPPPHGYPARLIVPGLYGYVSATKWLAEIELTTLEAFDAYWVPLGWAKEAPILTQSRIDVPGNRTQVAAGPTPVAGVAWAPDRGVSAVEVSVDEGPWRPATISEPLSAAAWVQWRWIWDATPGDHIIAVRATDGTGEVQTREISRPAPDGARGHHRIRVRVE